MQRKPIITKDFLLLFLFSVMVCTGMNMLNVIVPLYVTENLRQNTGVAGLMTTVYTIAACASRPVNGVLTDRCGRRTVMAVGILLFGCASLLCGLIPALAVLAICRVLMGIGYSAATTACNTASTDVIPAARISEGIGYFGMSQSAASAFGPALAAVVVAALGNQHSLFAVTAISAAAFLISLCIRYESRPGFTLPRSDAKGQRVSFLEKTAILPSLFQGLSLFLISCLMCFMTLYIVSIGFPASAAGSFFAAASVLIIVIRMTCSRLMNHLPTAALLIPGYVSLIAACLLLPTVRSYIGLLGVAVLYGFAHGTIWMTLGSEAVRLAPPEKRGAANATFYFAFDAAIGLGAAFWGGMIDRIGYVNCYYIIAICAGVLLLASIPAFAKRGKQNA